MPSRNVMDRLKAGELLLMDGGTGSEIQRRGAEVLIGASAEIGLQAWSATANIDFAHVVQQVHQDYIRCGADVIISNNFWTGPSRLEPIGLADRWEEYSRAAARNAVRARDAMDSEVYIAGGIAAPTKQGGDGNGDRSDVQIMGKKRTRRSSPTTRSCLPKRAWTCSSPSTSATWKTASPPWTRARRRACPSGWACVTSPGKAKCSTARAWKTLAARSKGIP